MKEINRVETTSGIQSELTVVTAGEAVLLPNGVVETTTNMDVDLSAKFPSVDVAKQHFEKEVWKQRLNRVFITALGGANLLVIGACFANITASFFGQEESPFDPTLVNTSVMAVGSLNLLYMNSTARYHRHVREALVKTRNRVNKLQPKRTEARRRVASPTGRPRVVQGNNSERE